MSAPSLDSADLEADGWVPVTERLPATDVRVFARQDKWAPVTAYLDERGHWKFIEYQHPHHVTHWKHK